MTPGHKARQKHMHTFSVDFEVDGERYTGSFTTRKMSIMDIAALGVRKAQLNGGMHHDEAHPGLGVDEETDNFNNMIAHLQIVITDAPVWWDLSKIVEPEVFTKVYQEVSSFENSFLRRQRTDITANSNADRGGQAGGSGDSARADSAGTAGSVVEQEVHASLEP